VCKSLGDGLTQEEIADYVGKNVDEYDVKFVIFCTNFVLKINCWLRIRI
jgi:hypothetical protein